MIRSVAQRRFLQTNWIRYFIKKHCSYNILSIFLGLARRRVALFSNAKFDIGFKKCSFHTVSFIQNEKKTDNILSSNKSSGNDNAHDSKAKQPQLMIAFTCKKCNTRSSHTMSKQAYTKGTVLIQCPGCKNRHLIADHLKIFSDHSINIEDILKAKGENVSQSAEDLVLEDIPEKLKPMLSKYVTNSDNEKTNSE